MFYNRSMSMPILNTKLYIPPTRPELVSRPRLIERLNEGLGQNQGFGRKLTLLSAPAGFGKTTLLSSWIDDLQPPATNRKLVENRQSEIVNRVAWLSLDDGDNDVVRFLAYVIAALQTVETNIGKGTLGMLKSPQPPPAESILTSLLNEIAALPDRLILVLDDYHLIETQPIHDALTFLLEHPPPQIHLVIATRDDPHLPLARLRARGQLTELRATDLRFTSAEAAEFLNQTMGLNLSAEDIAALETRTEGWITGLQLAAISIQRHKDVTGFIQSFSGSHHYVLDYLVEEVLEQQSESVQTFLLQTAVLNKLTGSLCDALTGQDNGQQTLEMLERANLFIVSLDQERQWYRYHHLFVDLLRRRLHERGSEHIPQLHCRASEWYEQNGLVNEAVDHALAAEEFKRAAYLIEGAAETLWGYGEQTQLLRWLEMLPAEQVTSRPHLCIFHAWGLFANGQLQAAELSLQAVEQAMGSAADGEATSDTPNQPPDPDRVKMQGRVAVIRAFMAFFRGDIPGIIQFSRQALEYLPEQDSAWRSSAAIALGDAHDLNGDLVETNQARLIAMKESKATGNIYLILTAGLKLALAQRVQGRLQQAIDICRQQLNLVNENGLSQAAMTGLLFAIWGEVLAELNDLDRAIQYTQKGTKLAENGNNMAGLGWCYVCLVRVLFSTGDMVGAEGIIQKWGEIAQKSDVPPWLTDQLAAWQARIWLTQGKLTATAQWAYEYGLNTEKILPFVHESKQMVFARLLIAQGHLDEATGLLMRLLKVAEEGGRTMREIEILTLQALAHQTHSDIAQAMAALKRALFLAEPGGFVRVFVDEGLPMVHLLYKALSQGIAPDYVRQLLAAYPVVEPEQTGSSKMHPSQPELIEPLSERELEVLQLIAKGRTNQEIATRLYLSLHTVKVHARNIYGKLGVKNRTQAVARGKVLGILSPT